jgi:hypothetical protein
VSNVVSLNKIRLTFELRLNWPNFDFDNSAICVAFNFEQLSAREARCNELNVGENAPRSFYRNRNSELMI